MIGRLLILASIGIALPSAAAGADSTRSPAAEMRRYVVALADKGTAWETAPAVREAHATYLNTLAGAGTLLGAGTVSGNGTLSEIWILDADSAAQVRDAVERDPDVRAGRLAPRLLVWFAAKGFGADFSRRARAGESVNLPPRTYQFGFLVRGPGWTPERTPEVEKIQAGHMANINRLAEEGTLVAAGPFVDGGAYRGIFVFDVPTVEEAERLTATDPAVIARRLRIELHTWTTAAGVIPEPARRTPRE
jgi:uncharacterized protein YciI